MWDGAIWLDMSRRKVRQKHSVDKTKEFTVKKCPRMTYRNRGKSTEYIIKVSTLQVVTENICNYNGKSIWDTTFQVPPDNDIWAVCGAIFIGTRESMNRLNWYKYYVTLGIIKGKRRRFGIIQKLCYKLLLLNGRREGTHGPGALPLREFK